MYDTILVPTDGSVGARVALEHATDLADTYDAAIHSLYVVNPAQGGELGGDGLLQALRSEGEKVTEDARTTVEEHGLAAESAVETGSVHRVVLDYAAEQDADLIVMGTHGRTGLDRYLLGSVTEKVVRLSDLPVLTVTAPDDED
jgi:nucleotide-binding universal stress UspA family protein